MRVLLLVLSVAAGCAATVPTASHSLRDDCRDIRPPAIPDGESVMTCEEDAGRFHWTISRAPRDLASCAERDVSLTGCFNGQRGLVCVRSQPRADGGYRHFDWHPVCR